MIAGGGFAMMAKRLAWIRVFGEEPLYDWGVLSREALSRIMFPENFPASFEYYRIIDAADRSIRSMRAQGLPLINVTVRL